jgi:hypothetical protein
MQESKSILGKRKYQDAMGYMRTPERGTSVGVSGFSGETTEEFRRMNENEAPEIQQQKLDIKYEKIPNFSKELFETSEGLQQIVDWFNGYNEYLLSNYPISQEQ